MSIAKAIHRLRETEKLSQTEFADLFHVSPQAVQKWEQGTSQPSVNNLISIAKHFNVSVDSLLLDSNGRIIEEMREKNALFPDFSGMHEWESYAKNLSLEYRQTTEEGFDITPYKEVMGAIEKLPDTEEKEHLAEIVYRVIEKAPQRTDFPFEEPNALEQIRSLREGKTGLTRKTQVPAGKILGAWLGRIIGCLLGKPIEGIRTDELLPILKESGNYPMQRYILRTDITEEMIHRTTFRLEGKCWADTIEAAPVDDDTNYTVLAQLLIERSGADFTSADVGKLWLQTQAKDAYCTAERVAFKNLVNGFAPPSSALYKNPFREWIGAQIRGDYFGYINPGDPEKAAEMAWRDARISHIKNGIYGEMYIAAMNAAAAVLSEPVMIIEEGLKQIPSTSRLYKEITAILTDYRKGVAKEACFRKIHRQYDEFNQHDWCHTISNAAIVTAALLYGEGDFARSICMAVQTGFDTDCNGATVGSIIGMMRGDKAIAEEWKAPLHGKLETSIFGVGTVSIEQLVETTIRHIEEGRQ